MAVVNDVIDALDFAKLAFDESTEAGDLANIISTSLGHGSINWLEVGAGDGRNLSYLISHLGLDHRANIVSIEPSRDLSTVPIHCRTLQWIKSGIEEYQPNAKFDIVNIRHSAYYFEDLVGEIERLSRHLSAHGSIILTHWSNDCALYKAHLVICNIFGLIPCQTFEEVCALLQLHAEIQIIYVKTTTTDLRVDVIGSSDEIAAAVFELARRNVPLPDRWRNEGPQIVRLALAQLAPPISRNNGILRLSRRS